MRKEYIKRIRMVLESDMKNKDLIKDLNAQLPDPALYVLPALDKITQIH